MPSDRNPCSFREILTVTKIQGQDPSFRFVKNINIKSLRGTRRGRVCGFFSFSRRASRNYHSKQGHVYDTHAAATYSLHKHVQVRMEIPLAADVMCAKFIRTAPQSGTPRLLTS